MQDLRLAVRTLRASPIVTAVAILSLALGIGANTAIFSLVDSLLLRPLPVVQPQRLALVSDTRTGRVGFLAWWPYEVWEAIRARAQPFDGACAWWMGRVNLAAHGGEGDPVDALFVSGSYFRTLGVSPLLGRGVTVDDDGDGHGRAVAVLSYAFWQRRFGGAASAIGSPIVIERVPFTIVGVAPPGFFGAEVGRSFDIALPINAEPLLHGADSLLNPQRGFAAFSVLLRLTPTQSVDAATAILRGIQPQIREAAMPPLPPPVQKEFLKDPFVVVPAAMGTSRLRVKYERPLIVMLVVVALVLFVACTNIANLQLARATARRHEMSVRIALGASAWRLVRQSLTESLLLAVAGATVGLLFAGWSSRLLVAQLSTWLNRIYLDLSLDWRVLVFTAAIAAATTVVAGLFAAVRSSRVAPIEALKEQTRGAPTESRVRMANGLVATQVALSIVIVFAAGLFVRSFAKLATVPLGFEGDRVLLVDVGLDRTQVKPADRNAFIERLVRDVGQVPGVTAASGSAITPVVGLGLVDLVHLPGIPLSFDPLPGGRLNAHATYLNVVTPGWFATYGMPIKAGRDFTDRDVKGTSRVIIVNEAFVRKFLDGRSPLGASVAFERGTGVPVQKTVVGIVGDAAYNSLRLTDEATEYVPLAQNDFPLINFTVSVRSAAASPMLLARSLAARLTAVDPNLTFGFRPMTEQVSASLTQERLTAMLAGFFGGLALLLAGLGLYGMTTYSVTCRRTEIGIRMALGATGVGVVRFFVVRATAPVLAGILLGLGASVWASQFVATMLFGVTPRDPVTLGGTAVTLAIVGTVAAWLPAYRASHLDPADVLREM